jgi:hypothetical protein
LGTYSESLDSGPNPVTIFNTAFLKDDELASIQYYVPNVTTAILNNYACVTLDGGEGTTVWPSAGFDPKSPLGYPDCFFNLQAVAIQDPA